MSSPGHTPRAFPPVSPPNALLARCPTRLTPQELELRHELPELSAQDKLLLIRRGDLHRSYKRSPYHIEARPAKAARGGGGGGAGLDDVERYSDRCAGRVCVAGAALMRPVTASPAEHAMLAAPHVHAPACAALLLSSPPRRFSRRAQVAASKPALLSMLTLHPFYFPEELFSDKDKR